VQQEWVSQLFRTTIKICTSLETQVGLDQLQRGEVTPLFFIGAAPGNALSAPLERANGLDGSASFIALFAGQPTHRWLAP
jgi:hypothetical protein